jgi:hypothetical protein
MSTQQPASEPSGSGPVGQRAPVPHVPEPDVPSPLHPEAPDRDHQAQVVAVSTDQVRGYLAAEGMPADEIDRLITEAHRAGSASFGFPPEPGRPAERLKLSFAGAALQLTVEDAGAGGH